VRWLCIILWKWLWKQDQKTETDQFLDSCLYYISFWTWEFYTTSPYCSPFTAILQPKCQHFVTHHWYLTQNKSHPVHMIIKSTDHVTQVTRNHICDTSFVFYKQNSSTFCPKKRTEIIECSQMLSPNRRWASRPCLCLGCLPLPMFPLPPAPLPLVVGCLALVLGGLVLDCWLGPATPALAWLGPWLPEAWLSPWVTVGRLGARLVLPWVPVLLPLVYKFLAKMYEWGNRANVWNE